MGSRVRHCYRFGAYRVDVTDRLLYKNAEQIALPPKVFDTLLMLVANHGHVLTKDEMLKQLWPDTFVEEGTLTQYISLLRKALGEHGHWVENLPRRGYRFTAPVEEDVDPPRDEAPAADLAPPPTGEPPHRRPVLVLIAIALVAIAAIAAFTMNRRNRAAQSDGIRSLAVLPFMNLSGDPNLDYISDG